VRLGDDEPSSAEHPPDRGDRRHLSAAEPDVVVDRAGPGVQAELGELLAQPDDLVLDLIGDPVGDPLRRA
jgi:hypothetical protein